MFEVHVEGFTARWNYVRALSSPHMSSINASMMQVSNGKNVWARPRDFTSEQWWIGDLVQPSLGLHLHAIINTPLCMTSCVGSNNGPFPSFCNLSITARSVTARALGNSSQILRRENSASETRTWQVSSRMWSFALSIVAPRNKHNASATWWLRWLMALQTPYLGPLVLDDEFGRYDRRAFPIWSEM